LPGRLWDRLAGGEIRLRKGELMCSVNTRRRILTATGCAALFLLYMASAVLPEESRQSTFKVLGPIPSRIQDTELYLVPADRNYDPAGLKGENCLKARSAVYDGLKHWQQSLHAKLGKAYRTAQKESEKEKAATKDPKRKKQIGEWETKLSINVHQMNKQIDDEYAAAVKKVHFKIPCSGK